MPRRAMAGRLGRQMLFRTDILRINPCCLRSSGASTSPALMASSGEWSASGVSPNVILPLFPVVSRLIVIKAHVNGNLPARSSSVDSDHWYPSLVGGFNRWDDAGFVNRVDH